MTHNKNRQGAPEAMPKLSGHNTKLESAESEKDGEVVNEGEMPKAALDALKKHKEKSETKEEKEEDKKDAKDEVKEEDHMDKDKKKDKEPMKAGYMSSSYKMKKEEVDEHMEAIVAGQDDLSEEFKTKAATVFESASKL